MPNPTFYRQYADLAVQVAVPVQVGQRLLIVSPPDTHHVARAITDAAYRQGAADVDVLYEDPHVQAARVRHASADALAHYPAWMAQALTAHALAAQPILTLHAAHPDPLPAHLDARVAASAAARNAALEGYGMRRSRVQFNWSVLAVATPAWAEYLRPDLPPADALEWLWGVLARLMRLDTPDPTAAWRDHAARLMDRCAALDALRIQELHFEGPGTDLRVGLPTGHRWFGPLVPSALGLHGVPNMPTEEISTLPHRQHVHGRVRMTRPLILQGQRIDHLDLTFEDGRVTQYHCSSGSDVMKAQLSADDGASRLGEVALVGEDSLVAQEQRVFYSTLLDENASCHIALGRAYPVTLTHGADMSAAEFERAGGNHSRIHIDFMIGSPQLQVTAHTEGGGAVVLLQDGRWVERPHPTTSP